MIKAVIFDWAGTVVDFGSRAPMTAFVNLFAQYGIKISIEDARRPMGINKWNHIDELLNFPHIQDQWLKKYGRIHTKSDIDEMLELFVPMNKSSIRECSDLIPKVKEVATELRKRGILIGATTGYTRELIDILIPLAKEQGYAPDACVCAGETLQGRPSAQMVARCCELLGIEDSWTVMKVDDTVPGLLEGLNFGCWTVGVSVSGNAMGLSLEEWNALSEEEKRKRNRRARIELKTCTPSYVIDTVAGLIPIIDDINEKQRGDHLLALGR